MAREITEEVYEIFDRLSKAAAALDHKMPLVQADVGEAAFLLARAKHELPKLLGYEDYDEFLEAIWEYEERRRCLCLTLKTN